MLATYCGNKELLFVSEPPQSRVFSLYVPDIDLSSVTSLMVLFVPPCIIDLLISQAWRVVSIFSLYLDRVFPSMLSVTGLESLFSISLRDCSWKGSEFYFDSDWLSSPSSCSSIIIRMLLSMFPWSSSFSSWAFGGVRLITYLLELRSQAVCALCLVI